MRIKNGPAFRLWLPSAERTNVNRRGCEPTDRASGKGSRPWNHEALCQRDAGSTLNSFPWVSPTALHVVRLWRTGIKSMITFTRLSFLLVMPLLLRGVSADRSGNVPHNMPSTSHADSVEATEYTAEENASYE